MLNVGTRRVFLCRQAVDMRKSFDSLADLVRTQLGLNPFQGDVFVFISADRTRAKVLLWESTGFWVCAKRLEISRFAPAMDGAGVTIALQPPQLYALLEQVVPRALRFAGRLSQSR